MTASLSMAPEPITEVACTCSCGATHTREKFNGLKLVTSPTSPSGRETYDNETVEFRRCSCGNTVAAKL